MNIDLQIYNDFKRGVLDDFYARAWGSLMSYAARLLGDRYAIMAEDCVQEAIVAAYDYRLKLVSPMQMKTFLFTCVHNRCITLLRKNTYHDRYARELLQEDLTEEEVSVAMIEQETIDLLRAAVNELPEIYRQIFELSFEQGLKNAEAARLLDITIDGFNKRKARMIFLLRERFKGYEAMQALISFLSTTI